MQASDALEAALFGPDQTAREDEAALLSRVKEKPAELPGHFSEWDFRVRLGPSCLNQERSHQAAVATENPRRCYRQLRWWPRPGLGSSSSKPDRENPLGGSKYRPHCGVNLTFEYSSHQSPRLLTVLIANRSTAVTHW